MIAIIYKQGNLFIFSFQYNRGSDSLLIVGSDQEVFTSLYTFEHFVYFVNPRQVTTILRWLTLFPVLRLEFGLKPVNLTILWFFYCFFEPFGYLYIFLTISKPFAVLYVERFRFLIPQFNVLTKLYSALIVLGDKTQPANDRMKIFIGQ